MKKILKIILVLILLIVLINLYMILSTKNRIIKEKRINNIDCAEIDNGLIRIKDFILVNCINGIAIISIKNKEMIQYIENFDKYLKNKKIFKSSNDIIYILNSKGDINKYYFSEYNLILFENIKMAKFDLLNNLNYRQINYKKQKLFLDNNDIFLWDDIIYSLVINAENW